MYVLERISKDIMKTVPRRRGKMEGKNDKQEIEGKAKAKGLKKIENIRA
jgi:hypothetical protein